ncbi:LAMI_0H08042g1_1 [Lachancea mirantina]|uniref:LAMI_0H08042g1_1 n=1 Tax=Lachancea mirantina TaxID=1230905 RepID=A0A1G4KG95_9SACH|nr:LAMI_0H08042g1_1 [Lachancea mirantina]
MKVYGKAGRIKGQIVRDNTEHVELSDDDESLASLTSQTSTINSSFTLRSDELSYLGNEKPVIPQNSVKKSETNQSGISKAVEMFEFLDSIDRKVSRAKRRRTKDLARESGEKSSANEQHPNFRDSGLEATLIDVNKMLSNVKPVSVVSAMTETFEPDISNTDRVDGKKIVYGKNTSILYSQEDLEYSQAYENSVEAIGSPTRHDGAVSNTIVRLKSFGKTLKFDDDLLFIESPLEKLSQGNQISKLLNFALDLSNNSELHAHISKYRLADVWNWCFGPRPVDMCYTLKYLKLFIAHTLQPNQDDQLWAVFPFESLILDIDRQDGLRSDKSLKRIAQMNFNDLVSRNNSASAFYYAQKLWPLAYREGIHLSARVLETLIDVCQNPANIPDLCFRAVESVVASGVREDLLTQYQDLTIVLLAQLEGHSASESMLKSLIKLTNDRIITACLSPDHFAMILKASTKYVIEDAAAFNSIPTKSDVLVLHLGLLVNILTTCAERIPALDDKAFKCFFDIFRSLKEDQDAQDFNSNMFYLVLACLCIHQGKDCSRTDMKYLRERLTEFAQEIKVYNASIYEGTQAALEKL